MIRLWEEHEELYSVFHSLYLDRGRKSLIFIEIADASGTTADEISKKKISLHSYYCQLRREHLNSGPTGSAAMQKIKWSILESLHFLKEPHTPNPTIGNLGSPPSVSSQGMSSYLTPNVSKKRRDDFRLSNEALMERAVTAFEKDNTAKREEISEDQAFSNLVAVKLSKIKEGDEKENAKMEILQSLVVVQRRQRAK